MNIFIFIQTYQDNDLSKVRLQSKSGVILNDTLTKLATPRWIKALENKTDPSGTFCFFIKYIIYIYSL